MTDPIGFGVVSLGLGAIGLALGITDRVTRSLVLRKYLIEQYVARDWFGHAQLARIPMASIFLAMGAAALAGFNNSVRVTFIGIAILAAALTLVAVIRVPQFLKPAWFRTEEAQGFPLLKRELPPEPKPAVLRIASAGAIGLIGILAVVAHSIPLGIVLIAVGVGIGYGDRFLRWPRLRPPR